MPRTTTAAPLPTQHSLQTVATQRHVAPPVIDLEGMLNKLRKTEKAREAAMLNELAAICIAFANLSLKDKANPYFPALIRFASEHRIIDDSQLAVMGDTKRETANRWVNGKATTSLAVQRQVLQRLAEHASNRSQELLETA